MPTQRFLGIEFWNRSCVELLRAADAEGGLLTVPSAPSLAQMRTDAALKEAYQSSDFAVVDGGYVALVLRFVLRRNLPRISGLQILEKLVGPDRGCAIPFAERRVLWVAPTAAERDRIDAFLDQQGFSPENRHWYLAPFYRTDADFEDQALKALVEEVQPDWIVLCIGGGKQEKLGKFLRQTLKSGGAETLKSDPASAIHGLPSSISHLPSTISPPPRPNGPVILCTGGAIAFFTGGQAKIPKWADRLYLGWLFRICESPKTFFPRYWSAAFEFPRLVWEERGGKS